MTPVPQIDVPQFWGVGAWSHNGLVQVKKDVQKIYKMSESGSS